MRYYSYNEYLDNEEYAIVTLSEDYILHDYWPYWQMKMLTKYPPGHSLITKENCLEDWIAINWAWEAVED